jgi:hypothetical protein
MESIIITIGIPPAACGWSWAGLYALLAHFSLTGHWPSFRRTKTMTSIGSDELRV